MLLYARKRVRRETIVTEFESNEAIEILKQSRKCDCQLGMIGDTSLQRVARVHGEFTFFKKVASVEELLKLS
ncbi:hypothetical protein [Clostridium beijerinckii]|uniref:hypothetical protein n=1 Tax=Clostridium beijerinckii TaxID=1520 RepID=UPI001494CE5A|nr:hypothetical protein [Clostridium beijerinckii]NOW04490.1 hypothetical protein [Clostridium beijerinckii]NYC02368.1 hypothetical protein [Clostridium beijerinckii]